MPKVTLGKITFVPLTDGWKDEPTDFTPWLAENLHLLSDALQIDLEFVRREAPVGKFRLDILAKNSNGNVAIENQLGQTDHDHMGKLLTYAAGHDVGTLIWVAGSFRDEHRETLTWLNQKVGEDVDVYGVEIRLLSIHGFSPAPQFVPVVYPVDTPPAGGGVDKDALLKFYQRIVNRLRENEVFNDIQDARGGFIQSFPSKDASPLIYNMDVGGYPRVFISMPDKAMKIRVFDNLRKDHKEEIEEVLDIAKDDKTRMVWGSDGKATNIRVRRNKEGSDLASNLTKEVEDWMYHYLIEFKEVFDHRVAKIIGDRHAAAETDLSEHPTPPADTTEPNAQP